MLKLRSMMEDVAEKLFGHFLPQVEAWADNHDCAPWEPDGCCGPNMDRWQFKRYCTSIGWTTDCTTAWCAT